jgi:hypothetical protein
MPAAQAAGMSNVSRAAPGAAFSSGAPSSSFCRSDFDRGINL